MSCEFVTPHWPIFIRGLSTTCTLLRTGSRSYAGPPLPSLQALISSCSHKGPAPSSAGDQQLSCAPVPCIAWSVIPSSFTAATTQPAHFILKIKSKACRKSPVLLALMHLAVVKGRPLHISAFEEPQSDAAWPKFGILAAG